MRVLGGTRGSCCAEFGQVAKHREYSLPPLIEQGCVLAHRLSTTHHREPCERNLESRPSLKSLQPSDIVTPNTKTMARIQTIVLAVALAAAGAVAPPSLRGVKEAASGETANTFEASLAKEVERLNAVIAEKDAALVELSQHRSGRTLDFGSSGTGDDLPFVPRRCRRETPVLVAALQTVHLLPYPRSAVPRRRCILCRDGGVAVPVPSPLFLTMLDLTPLTSRMWLRDCPVLPRGQDGRQLALGSSLSEVSPATTLPSRCLANARQSCNLPRPWKP